MLASEKLAIAAHLHVLLRRKTGRVTDTQWMADNADYAAEIVRFARRSAQEDGHVELVAWADKLESAVLPAKAQHAVERPPSPVHAVAPSLRSLLATVTAPSHGNADAQGDGDRYVRGLR